MEIADIENDVLCEKIINDINAVLTRDPDVTSFEIIPTLSYQNKSPVIHVEHNLGLESWCAKHVYDFSHKTILASKLSGSKYIYNDSLVKYLNCALLINPDVTTFWHIRRQLVEKNKLKIQKEFQFAALVLTKKPKASEAFAYRRWLYPFQSAESIDWSIEIGICDRCADKSLSNYHAWSHRQWVLERASHLLRSEILHTEKFIKKHISDYSCYHYRQFVLQTIFDICYYDKEQNEYNSLRDFINFYLVDGVSSVGEIIQTLLPNIDLNATNEDKLKCFLYCCNFAAYDIKFCDDLKNLFGFRESFENHRRASLRFIVENCMRFNSTVECYQQPPVSKLSKFDYSSNAFLMALKKSEGMLGEQHRKWCLLFLNFDYSDNSD